MALEAATEVFGEGPKLLERISFDQMLVLPAGGDRIVQVALTDEGRPFTWNSSGTIMACILQL